MRFFFRKTEDAVSPVLGVMLMLVVTVVIAALVAGFASGIGSGTDTVPFATVSADYSQTKGLTLTHLSGDVLDFAEIEAVVSPSAGFKVGYRTMAWTVTPAETNMYLDAGQSKLVASPAGIQGDDSSNNNYGFNKDTAVGKYFTLKLVQDGKTITETEVLITP